MPAARRREALVPQAPIFWRPAPDAVQRHRAFPKHLLTSAGAHGYRTDDSVLIVVPRSDGWLLDDAWVPHDQWLSEDGAALGNALAAHHRGEVVRFVSPSSDSQWAGIGATSVCACPRDLVASRRGGGGQG